MARALRVSAPEITQHIIQRGVNKQSIFHDKSDRLTFIEALCTYSQKFSVSIHAYVLMTNHIHLLATPHVESGASKMMHSLGTKYCRFFNYKYERTGSLWEGRFKSFNVLDESYLLTLYRYIELNPVRSNLVSSPELYPWSSHRNTALGVNSQLLTPHSIYLSLGASNAQRQSRYRALFDEEFNLGSDPT